MTAQEQQGTLFEDNAEYEAFTAKFEAKKTTDDCYTPAIVYDAVQDWVCSEYGVDPSTILRPFWPGGDYQALDYPQGCTVVDNPPFSILSKILKWYEAAGVRYFLFGPALTLFSNANTNLNRCYIPTGADVVYENGAIVKTSFITNLDPLLVRTAPELKRAVEAASDENQRANKSAPLPKYIYPDEIITAAMVQRWSHYGIEFRLKREDAVFVRALDSQRAAGKAIFGGGFLLSKRAAAERAAAERAAAERAAAERAAERWPLSDRETRIVSSLPSESVQYAPPAQGQADNPLPGQSSLFKEG